MKHPALIALLNMGGEQSHSNGATAPNGEAWLAAEQARIARGLCEDAAAQPSSLLLEQWASMLLGGFWESRQHTNVRRRADRLAMVGTPVLRSIAGVGSPDAKLALLALSRIERGALGSRARQLADELPWPLPPQVEEVGTTRLVRAFHGSSPGDGEVVMFQSERTGPLAHMLVVYIDLRHRSLAKHVALLQSFDPLRPETLPGGGSLPLEFQPADLAEMSRKVDKAIKRTDAAANPPVDQSFSDYRAIALARLTPIES